MQSHQIERRFGELNRAGKFSFLLITKILTKFDHTNIKIMHYWKEIIGEELADDVYPIKITTEKENGLFKKTFHLGVRNAVAAMMVDFQKDLIIERITSFLGKQIIHKIKIIQSHNQKIEENIEEHKIDFDTQHTGKFDIADENLNRILTQIDYLISTNQK